MQTPPSPSYEAHFLFRFGLIADAQYCDHPAAGSRYYRQSLSKLSDCVSDLKNQDLAFTVHVGDLIDRDFASFGQISPLLAPLTHNVYQVLGNHDFSVEADELGEVLGVMGLERGYYDVVRDGWRFIMLNGTEVSTYAYPEGHPQQRIAQQMLEGVERQGLPQAYSWNGALGDIQLQWLEDRLAYAAGRREKVVLICHFPVFPKDAHNLWDAESVLDLIRRSPHVVAWINGHNHGGNYAYQWGTHFVNLRGMVETPDSTAYSTVEVYENMLVMAGRGRELNRRLAFAG